MASLIVRFYDWSWIIVNIGRSYLTCMWNRFVCFSHILSSILTQPTQIQSEGIPRSLTSEFEYSTMLIKTHMVVHFGPNDRCRNWVNDKFGLLQFTRYAKHIFKLVYCALFIPIGPTQLQSKTCTWTIVKSRGLEHASHFNMDGH